MNHFVSGIIKIVLLEASVALLLIDLVAGERLEKVRAWAAGALAGLMVFAWANYGALRPNTSVGYALTALPLILACAWLVKAGFGTGWSDSMKGFRDQAAKLHATHGPRIAAVALAAALATGWVWQGVRSNSVVMVHQWEQFHFYLGAKYQHEVGWFNLYKAALLADRESAHVLDQVTTTRDLASFDEIPVAEALRDGAQVRARFSDATWEAFKADWKAFTVTFPMNWGAVVNDHGNSNSPAWSLFAAPLAHWLPVSQDNNALLGWLDMLLMLGLWLFLWQAFGHRAAAMGLFVFAMMPLVFDYLSGSFLRWDWLFALGCAAGCLKLKRHGAAGAFFGYAVATKLFPLFFGVALGIRAFYEWRRTRTFAVPYRRFLVGTLASGAFFVVAATLAFGPEAWLEYARRIETAQVEKFYAIQYSLKTVYLQVAAGGWPLVGQGLFPGELAQMRRDVDIKDYAVGFFLIRLVFTALIAQLIRRADDVEAFVLGPLLVFTWLTVNMYYWNMFGLMAIGLMLRAKTQRPALTLLIGLQVILMFFYLYQHLNRGLTEGFAVASLLAGLVAAVSVWEWRVATAPVPAAKAKPAAS